MSTKGAIFLIPEYLDKLKKAPHLFWIAFSIITDDDILLSKIDRYAPNATKRLECMKALSSIGCSTSLRLRPITFGITDKNKAYKSLIEKAAKAGAKAISYEVAFYPSTIPGDNLWKWQMIDALSGYKQKDIYMRFGKLQACSRPSYTWTESIMHEIRDISKANGLNIGVSDPVWKQLGETGCCCGIMPDDPVFGNWQKESATNRLLEAKDGPNKRIYFKDICPDWAGEQLLSKMMSQGVGPKAKWKTRHNYWKDHLLRIWNNPSAQRSPLNYFQGALKLCSETDSQGNLVYEYVGLERKYKNGGWNV